MQLEKKLNDFLLQKFQRALLYIKSVVVEEIKDRPFLFAGIEKNSTSRKFSKCFHLDQAEVSDKQLMQRVEDCHSSCLTDFNYQEITKQQNYE